MKGDPQTRPAAVNAHHVEAARLALGHAALHSRKLAVLAAIDERTTFHAGRVVVKVDSATRRLEHEPAMMAAAGGVGLPVPAVIAFERGPPGVLLMRHVPAEALRPSRVAPAGARRRASSPASARTSGRPHGSVGTSTCRPGRI